MTDADERVARYILRAYREAHPRHHLATCPDTQVEDPDAARSGYGCETGCEYTKFTATLRCPHERHDFEYGEFGELADILDDLDRPAPEPPPPVIVSQTVEDAGLIEAPHEVRYWRYPAENPVIAHVTFGDSLRLRVRVTVYSDGSRVYELIDQHATMRSVVQLAPGTVGAA